MGRSINADAYASTGHGVLGNNMFAYCYNSPICCTDDSGFKPSSAFSQVCVTDEGLGFSDELLAYFELKDYLNSKGISLYYSIDSALAEWSNTYVPLSEEHEYVAFLYSIDTPFGEQFYFSTTVKGTKKGLFQANVIAGTLMLGFEHLVVSSNLVAHVHTHPKPSAGFHNDFPSDDPGLTGGDRIAAKFFPEMYVIPYKTCVGTPSIIIYSDRTTWCQHR